MTNSNSLVSTFFVCYKVQLVADIVPLFTTYCPAVKRIRHVGGWYFPSHTPLSPAHAHTQKTSFLKGTPPAMKPFSSSFSMGKERRRAFYRRDLNNSSQQKKGREENE